MRRFGAAYIEGKPYRDRPGAYAIITDGQDLLVAATTNQGEDFLLPGGGIDPGESPQRALHREVMEETGFSIAISRRLGAFQRYTFMPDYGFWARKVCHIYLCQVGRQLADPIEPDHTPVWMTPEEAAVYLSVSGERHFVQEWMSGRV